MPCINALFLRLEVNRMVFAEMEHPRMQRKRLFRHRVNRFITDKTREDRNAFLLQQ
ncbi:hypothetical protein D3C86_2237780 [compost metagenome]